MTTTRLAFGVLLSFGVMTAGAADSGVTGTWNGAAGDGLWSTPGNWENDTLPGSGKAAVLSATTDTVITVDIAGVKLSTLKFTDAAKVTLKGEKISFVSGGKVRLPNASDAVRPVIYNDLSFAGDFSFDGLTDAADDRANSRGVFYGTIESPGTLQVLFGGYVYCYGQMHIGGQTGAYATGAAGHLCYYATGNTVTNSAPTYSYPHLCAKNAMTKDFVFNWSNSWEGNGTGRYYIEGYDQVCDHIGTGKSWTLGCMLHVPSGKSATIYQFSKKSVVTPVLLDGAVSVVWDPLDASYVQTFSNRTHATTGSLIVSNGTMRVAAGSNFNTLKGITVAPGARFEVATEVAGSFAAVTAADIRGTLAVEDVANAPFGAAGFTFDLRGDGCLELATALSVPRLRVDGIYQTNGVYTAANCAFVTGAGSVTVTDGESFTAWNQAADGNWSDAAKWTKGAPVSSAKPAYITAENADYTVTLDTNKVAIGNLTLANDPAHSSTLSVTGRTAFVEGNVITVNCGGVFEQAAGSISSITNSATSHKVNNGGIWRVKGTNDFYASGNGIFTVNAGGKLEVSGKGRVNFRHGTTYNAHMNINGGLELSDDANVTVVGQNGEPRQFSGATVVLRDRAKLDISRFIMSPGNNLVNAFDFYGQSSLATGSGIIAGYYSSGSKVLVTLHDSATVDFGETSEIGCNVPAYAEVNVGSGTSLTFGNTFGAWVGSQKTKHKDDGVVCCPTGVVNVAGKAVVKATYYLNPPVDSHDDHRGMIIGGMARGLGQHSQKVTGNVWCRGTLNVLPGGTFEQQYGLCSVGIGKGTGELNVRGGTFKKTLDGYYGGYTIVGMAGGQGLLSVSEGGTATIANPAWIGGVATNTINRNWANFPADSLAATGIVRVANGTVAFNGTQTVFGGLGTGILEIGTAGAVTTKELVLSNNVASVVRFTLGETKNDYGTLSVAGNLTIATGAKLVVDGSAFAGQTGRFPIVRTTGAITGDFAQEDVALLGKGLVLKKRANGYDAVFQGGLMIYVR